MRRAIRPAWLVRLARELALGNQTAGQPRNADLRRATSTAYYAVFHRVAIDTSRNVLGNASWDESYSIARHVTHASVRQVSVWVKGDTPPRHLDVVVNRLRASNEVTQVALAFLDLYEQREAADYDHLADFTRPGTLVLVELADRAVNTVFKRRDSGDFRAFLGLIALCTNPRHR